MTVITHVREYLNQRPVKMHGLKRKVNH